MPLPSLAESGELPPAVHVATIGEIVERFATGTPQRRIIGTRLTRVHELAAATGYLDRFFVFGSFVTDTPAPNDADVFMLMKESFDLSTIHGEARILFEHAAAQTWFGASVFWLRRRSAYPTEADAIEGWQIKRDGSRRGIVEIVSEAT